MPPPLVVPRCREVHAVLVEEGWIGKTIKRPDFDRLFTVATGLSIASTRVHVETGRLLGLWDLLPHIGPRPGGVRVLPPQPTEPRDESLSIHA